MEEIKNYWVDANFYDEIWIEIFFIWISTIVWALFKDYMNGIME